MADDVGVAVVVDDHVHLGDAGEVVVDLDAEQVFLREVMPVAEVVAAFLRGGEVVWEKAVGFRADEIERVEEEAAGAARGIDDEVVRRGPEHLDGEGDEFARGEILAEVALEKAAHEFLEGDALGVEIGAGEADGFKVIDDLREDGRLDVDAVGEDIRLARLLGLVELVDARGKVFGGFLGAALEVVGLALFALVHLVADFDEDDFAELAKGFHRIALAAFPKRLVAFADGGAEFLARDGAEVFACGSFVETIRAACRSESEDRR